MLILGLHGNLNPIHENIYGNPFPEDHDAAAVLLRDGEVIAGVEEERLNRFKHCHCQPVESIRYCLREAGVGLRDLDCIAVPAPEMLYTAALKERYYMHAHTRRPIPPPREARDVIAGLLQEATGSADDVRDRIHFVEHHEAHAASTYFMSGFDRSLVLTIDGEGAFNSGLILSGEGRELKPLGEIPKHASLGWFYSELIRYLGYWFFDEYKVMGLAPYGDPARFRDLLRSMYDLGENGEHRIYRDRFLEPYLFGQITPRKKGEPITQEHKDLAAALQEALETIALHILRHQQRATGHRNLCLAGGVAHNCTMNGKILASGLFDDVFVQPAAHDSGLSLGAALDAYHRRRPDARPRRLTHVYWGPDVGGADAIEATLRAWSGVIAFRRAGDVVAEAAGLLAGGAILGWVQGRSEFGPRALGNRSILADPRPAENRAIVNDLIKRREGFRPFAPSVCEEHLRDHFEVPGGVRALPFMIFVCGVREDRRALLGAVTHVDGTARVQTVSRETNPRYWALLQAFRERTGLPVLLNTSFNNDVEPIVDSVEDALTCFLTTGLRTLVVGDYIVEKRAAGPDAYLDFAVEVPVYYRVTHVRRHVPGQGMTSIHSLVNAYDPTRDLPISAALFAVIVGADGERTLRELLAAAGPGAAPPDVVLPEALELWSRRGILLRPTAAAAGGAEA